MPTSEHFMKCLDEYGFRLCKWLVQRCKVYKYRSFTPIIIPSVPNFPHCWLTPITIKTCGNIIRLKKRKEKTFLDYSTSNYLVPLLPWQQNAPKELSVLFYYLTSGSLLYFFTFCGKYAYKRGYIMCMFSLKRNKK